MSACMGAIQVGRSGGMPPPPDPQENFWLLLRPFLARRHADADIHMKMVPLHHTAQVSAFRSFADLANHTFTDEACETTIVRSKEDSEEFFRTVWSHFASLKMPGVWLGALRGRPPSNGANWRRQVSHGGRKKWSGWNLTNRTGGYGTALYVCVLNDKLYS